MTTTGEVAAVNGAGPPELTRHGSNGETLPATVFITPPKRMDELVTKEEFVAFIMRYMMNDNPINHFMTIWRDPQGEPQYTKAKSTKRADEHLKWAYDTMSGKARIKTSMGAYAKNRENKSTWAAMDFDAHSGDLESAQKRALRAFTLLLEFRDRYVILSASGRGYHVYVFARELRPVREWTALLENVAENIPVSIQDGQCELFPAAGTELQPTGRAIRIPGSYNPTTDSMELILAETIRPLLDELSSTLISDGSSPRQLIRDREVNNYSYSTKRVYLLDSSSENKIDPKRNQNRIDGFLSASTARIIEETISNHPVPAKGTRNGVLCELIGDLIHKFGCSLSWDIALAHYARNFKNLRTDNPEHYREFCVIWESLLKKIIGKFSANERAIYDQLNSQPQREAFVIIRSFAHLVNGEPFPVAQFSLADRLKIGQSGAFYVIARLIDLKAIERVEPARKNSRAARYRWIALR